MIPLIGVAGAVTATLHGFCPDGLAAMRAGAPYDRNILRPRALRGKVLQIDPATSLSAAAAVRLRETLHEIPAVRIGVVVASRIGNYQILRDFSAKVKRGGRSPVQFAASGYNACAGVAAMAAAVNGPSMALAGGSATMGDALALAAFYILRGDADAVIAGAVSIESGGESGGCAFIALTAALSADRPAIKIGGAAASAGAVPVTAPEEAGQLLARVPDLTAAFALATMLERGSLTGLAFSDFPSAVVGQRIDVHSRP